MKGDLADEPRSSGAVLLNLWTALRHVVGDDAYARGLATLRPDQREEILAALPISWVRMATSFALVEAAAHEAKKDPDAVYDEVVKRSVVTTYRGVWKVLLRFTTPEALLTRASLMYEKSRNWGKMTATLLGPGRAELRVTEWPHMEDRFIRSIAVSSAAILELTGQRRAEYTYAPTRDGAVIEMKWASPRDARS